MTSFKCVLLTRCWNWTESVMEIPSLLRHSTFENSTVWYTRGKMINLKPGGPECMPANCALSPNLLRWTSYFIPTKTFEMKICRLEETLNPFHVTDLFWYPLKTENLWFFDIFRGYQKRSEVWNGLIDFKIIRTRLQILLLILSEFNRINIPLMILGGIEVNLFV